MVGWLFVHSNDVVFGASSSRFRLVLLSFSTERLCLILVRDLWQCFAVKEKTDQELLAMVLRTQFDRVANMSFVEIIQAGKSELGLTDVAYDRLMAGIELGKRVAEPKTNYNTRISSTRIATEFCRVRFARLISEGLQEEFHVVTLDTKHRMIGSHQITVGTLDASLVHPREVFKPAIKDSASCILLVHNHPSGDPSPSREDHAVTRRLTDAGNTIGITVLDHIVVAKEGCVSVREYG